MQGPQLAFRSYAFKSYDSRLSRWWLAAWIRQTKTPPCLGAKHPDPRVRWIIQSHDAVYIVSESCHAGLSVQESAFFSPYVCLTRIIILYTRNSLKHSVIPTETRITLTGKCTCVSSPIGGRFNRTMSDPSIPCQADSCHLLRLPREVRDAIYSWALFEPDGLFYRYEENTPSQFRMFSSLDAAMSGTAMDPNRLKYVCRLLYDETRGLGIALNDLHFVRFNLSHPPSSEQFLAFTSHCSPRRLDQLRTVTFRRLKDEHALYTTSKDDGVMKHGNRVFDFCAKHPLFRAKVYMPLYGTPRRPGIDEHFFHIKSFFHGFAYQSAYRDRDLSKFFPNAFVCAYPQRMAGTYRGPYPEDDFDFECDYLPQRFTVPNYEVWLTRRDFDEAAFREAWSTAENAEVRGTPARFPGGLDAMVSEVKRWYAKGVLSEPQGGWWTQRYIRDMSPFLSSGFASDFGFEAIEASGDL